MDSSVVERIQKAKEINACMSANGVLFDKSVRGFLPELIHDMYQERKEYKRKMLECKTHLKENKDKLSEKEIRQLELDISKYHIFQTVKKVCLNSAFGTVGNQYFRHFDIDLAEAITLSGQLVIRWIERDLNQYLNKMLGTENEDFVIASDTDSVYIRLNDVVEKFIPDKDRRSIVEKLDRFCNDMLSPFIQKSCQRFHDELNCPIQSLNMKREVIADKAVWTAKKRYMMNVYMGEDNVLLNVPEMKIMGIEVVRSSTPQVVREALRECIQIILNRDENSLMKYISDFREKFENFDVEDISFPRTCSDVTKYHDSTLIYKKSTPIAVKGALLYNNIIRKNKLEKKHSIIKDGEKVKFVYLKEPNPVGGKVVSFPNNLPKELNLHKYVDRQLQFEKTFLEPLKTITESIRWSTEKKATLESLFV
jgi:DNA polymerase elongation subunit (family B)